MLVVVGAYLATVSMLNIYDVMFAHYVPAYTRAHSCLTALCLESRYQKKRLTHTHEEEEGFTQTTRSPLNQQRLLDPIKPARNQSWPGG